MVSCIKLQFEFRKLDTAIVYAEFKSDQPSSDQPSSDQPSSDQPSSDQPSSDRPSCDQPSSDQPSSDRPSSNQTSSDQPSSNQTSIDQPSSNQTSSDQPSSNQPSSDHVIMEPYTKVISTSDRRTDALSSQTTKIGFFFEQDKKILKIIWLSCDQKKTKRKVCISVQTQYSPSSYSVVYL